MEPSILNTGQDNAVGTKHGEALDVRQWLRHRDSEEIRRQTTATTTRQRSAPTLDNGYDNEIRRPTMDTTTRSDVRQWLRQRDPTLDNRFNAEIRRRIEILGDAPPKTCKQGPIKTLPQRRDCEL